MAASRVHAAASALAVAMTGAAAHAEPHPYFDALVARPEHWRSYSLRDQAQLRSRVQGGYAQGDADAPLYVNYLYPDDPDPRRQDAARVVVPDFVDSTTLAAPISATDTTLTLTAANGLYIVRRSIEVDGEVMLLTSRTDNTITVTRAARGTSAAPHAAGARVRLNTNSLPNQVWLPMGTEDGHTYLTTWDAWYGRELRAALTGLVNWKTFQFRAGAAGSTSIWFEVRTRFDGGSTPWDHMLDPATDIAVVDARGYGPLGPGTTSDQPLRPQTGTLVVRAETWTRYWMLLEQNAGTWDRVSLWVADENTDPVRVIDRLEVESGAGVEHFDLEFNTSTDAARPTLAPLVTYVRNVVVLRDLADPTRVFQRPTRGAEPIAPFPDAGDGGATASDGGVAEAGDGGGTPPPDARAPGCACGVAAGRPGAGARGWAIAVLLGLGWMRRTRRRHAA